MARLFLYTLLALGVGAALALLLKEDPGYVLVSFREWTFEATLGAVFLGTLALFVGLFACLWLLVLLNPLKLLRPSTWQGWLGSGNAEEASARGLQELLLGRWPEAYRLLVENAEKVENPLFNYLAGAFAAAERGDQLGWQFCLDRAEKTAGPLNYGVRSMRAILERRAGNTRQAQVVLQALKRVAPPSPLLLRQLKDIYRELPDWEALAALLPELEKHQVVDATEAHELHEGLHLHRLDRATNESLESLQAAWAEVPKDLRDSEALVQRYIQYLLRHEQDAEVGTILTQFLKRQWSDSLIRTVGYLKGGNPQHLLVLLEEALKQRPNNPVLMLTLGRLSLHNQLWGKARDYFEHALKVAHTNTLIAEISAELARLLEHLGEEEESLACYQRAMQMMDNKLPDLPMPVTPR
ncbi:MAG TPA: hypothetical protein GX696_03375 [Pseudomonadaceae bacterium]|nr:hypothetical protein [Pseudomonadaceae bacterium]